MILQRLGSYLFLRITISLLWICALYPIHHIPGPGQGSCAFCTYDNIPHQELFDFRTLYQCRAPHADGLCAECLVTFTNTGNHQSVQNNCMICRAQLHGNISILQVSNYIQANSPLTPFPGPAPVLSTSASTNPHQTPSQATPNTSWSFAHTYKSIHWKNPHVIPRIAVFATCTIYLSWLLCKKLWRKKNINTDKEQPIPESSSQESAIDDWLADDNHH